MVKNQKLNIKSRRILWEKNTIAVAVAERDREQRKNIKDL